MSESEIKQQVRHFYDQVGWQVGDDGLYQNARYEDLRPVARDYIHRCHLRVRQFLKPTGRFLLDAGSGPIQYPEYLVYSEGYRYRVCADLSMVALREAHRRIDGKGLFVVADIANLPFKAGVFEGEVSLHMIHHLPPQDHLKVYEEFYRVLAPSGAAVLVNGWSYSPLMNRMKGLVWLMDKVLGLKARLRKPASSGQTDKDSLRADSGVSPKKAGVPTGTYVKAFDAGWMVEHL